MKALDVPRSLIVPAARVVDLPDARFLDLFAGSGAIGIEALSRGAERAWFVEQNKAAADCIRQNLKFTKLEQQAVRLLRQWLRNIHHDISSWLLPLPEDVRLYRSFLLRLRTSWSEHTHPYGRWW